MLRRRRAGGRVPRRESVSQSILRLEAPGRRSRGRAGRRLIDVMKEDTKLVGVSEEAAEREAEMEAADWLQPPRKETAAGEKQRRGGGVELLCTHYALPQRVEHMKIDPIVRRTCQIYKQTVNFSSH